MSKRTWLALVPVAIGLLTVGVFSTRAAESKEIITFQCRLVQDGTPVSGSMDLCFEVWTAQTGGSIAFVETRSVVVNNGLVSTQLGSDPANPIVGVFSSNGDLWIAVKLGGTDLLQDRVKLTAVPFSMNAARASTLWDSAAGQEYEVGDFVLGSTSGGNTTVVGQAGTLILQASSSHVSSGTVILHGTIDVTSTLKVGEVIELANTTTPSSVTSGSVALYAKSGLLYYKPSAGGETPIVGGGGAVEISASHSDGRLSAHESSAVDVAALSTRVYFHRYKGGSLAVYDGSSWSLASIPSGGAYAELSLASTDTVYDVFGYDDSGVVALEVAAWSTHFARATSLAFQDGVRVKEGDSTRRYLGTIYVDDDKKLSDSTQAREVWNVANRLPWRDFLHDSTNNWAVVGNGTWGAMNGGDLDWQHSFVIGLSGFGGIEASMAFNSVNQYFATFALDSTSSKSPYSTTLGTGSSSFGHTMSCDYAEDVAIGKHVLQGIERVPSGLTGSAYSDSGGSTYYGGMIVSGSR